MSLHSKSKRKLVYILSPSFSGSTLLTLLMAQHDKIATIGELKATAMGPVENYVCSCGQLISDCAFWKNLSRKLSERGVSFNFENFGTHFSSDRKLWNKILRAQVRSSLFERMRTLSIRLTPGLHQHFNKIISVNHAFIEAACDILDAEFFLDGSKDPQRLIYLYESDLWEIYVIRMYRDGRAQSHSRRNKPRNPLNFAGAVDEWRETIHQMNYVSSILPQKNLLTIRYEDLCCNPEEALSRIWNFLGVEELELNWQKIDLKQSEHHILGNRMRTRDSIQIRLDEKWKSELTHEELKTFDRIAGKVNQSLSYPPLLRAFI